jgi:hypothetical protein
LAPPFVQGRDQRAITGEPDGQALGAAASLELVKREGTSYSLTSSLAGSYSAFADQVHGRLCSINSSDPDYVVLETFAWVVAEVERRRSTAWAGANPQEFADAVEHAIGGGQDASGDRRFNSTKIPAWRRWIVFMGLGVDLPGNIGFYPYIAERLARELSASGLPTDVDLPAAEPLELIAQRMPYIDGGFLFLQIASRTGLHLPARRISRLLSIALRDLHDEGMIVLGMRGDASDLLELAPDGQHPIRNIQTIRLVGQVQ